jgi:hypothetical protein
MLSGFVSPGTIHISSGSTFSCAGMRKCGAEGPRRTTKNSRNSFCVDRGSSPREATWRRYGETATLSLVPLRACTVSFVGPGGVRHAVEVTAESLYEAAIVGVSLLQQEGWADAIAPGTAIDIQVRAPATTHSVTVAQLRRWCEGVAASPEEILRKRKLSAILRSP